MHAFKRAAVVQMYTVGLLVTLMFALAMNPEIWLGFVTRYWT
jgi:hypothetical protein